MTGQTTDSTGIAATAEAGTTLDAGATAGTTPTAEAAHTTGTGTTTGTAATPEAAGTATPAEAGATAGTATTAEAAGAAGTAATEAASTAETGTTAEVTDTADTADATDAADAADAAGAAGAAGADAAGGAGERCGGGDERAGGPEENRRQALYWRLLARLFDPEEQAALESASLAVVEDLGLPPALLDPQASVDSIVQRHPELAAEFDGLMVPRAGPRRRARPGGGGEARGSGVQLLLNVFASAPGTVTAGQLARWQSDAGWLERGLGCRPGSCAAGAPVVRSAARVRAWHRTAPAAAARHRT